MYKLGIYIPDTHVEQVKSAMFSVGAGRIGNYDSCCWQTSGIGQFRPLAGSQPAIGERGIVETVSETRLELVVEDALIHVVLAAMRSSHPYEEPAFDVVKLLDFPPRDED